MFVDIVVSHNEIIAAKPVPIKLQHTEVGWIAMITCSTIKADMN